MAEILADVMAKRYMMVSCEYVAQIDFDIFIYTVENA